MRVRLKHERLAAEMARSRMSQNAWARRVGISRGHMSNLVNGKRPYPGAITRGKLLDALDLPFEVLFEIEYGESDETAHPIKKTQTPSSTIDRPHIDRQTTNLEGNSQMKSLLQEFGQAIRGLRRSPSFTVVATLILALGIGANIAIYSVLRSSLLSKPPFPDPGQLFTISTHFAEPRVEIGNWSYPLFEDFRSNVTGMEVAAYTAHPYLCNLSGLAEPIRVRVEFVSHKYFSVLGMKAALGRTFSNEEDSTPSSHPVAVISNSLWQRTFGGQDSAIGRTITLNTVPLTIVGVLPKGFAGLSERAEAWVPMMMAPRLTFPRRLSVRLAFWHNVVARESDQSIESELARAAPGIAESFGRLPGGNRFGFEAEPLADTLTDDSIRQPLLILSAAVGFVLLIACANVSSLLIARSAARRREISIRSALGASRLQLMRQFLCESLCLAFLGGAIAIPLGWGIIHGLSPLYPSTPNGPKGLEAASLDLGLLTFTLGVSIAAAVLAGTVPGLASLPRDLASGLRGAGAEWQTRIRGGRLRPLLAVGELALALVLVTGAGLTLKSFLILRSVPLGFDPQNVLTAQINLPSQAYSPKQATYFFSHLASEVSALPSILSASIANCLPVKGGCDQTSVIIEGVADADTSNPMSLRVNLVDESFFNTMGMTLLQGRGIEASDIEGKPWVAVLNQAAASRFWPGLDPLGKRVRPSIGLPEGEFAEVVGIVADSKSKGLRGLPAPTAYLSYRQLTYRSNFIAMRLEASRLDSASELRRIVRSLDPNLPLWNVRTMRQRIDESASSERFSALLMAAFALLAMVLAVLGLYAVQSHGVASRTREFGVRLALGAGKRELLRLVLLESLVLTGIGLAVGLVAALALTRFLSGLLFGVGTADVLTFTTAALTLGLISLLACLQPARRAMQIDPIKSLRCE